MYTATEGDSIELCALLSTGTSSAVTATLQSVDETARGMYALVLPSLH